MGLEWEECVITGETCTCLWCNLRSRVYPSNVQRGDVAGREYRTMVHHREREEEKV